MDGVAVRVFIFSILPVISLPAISDWTGGVEHRERRLEEKQKEDCFATVDP